MIVDITYQCLSAHHLTGARSPKTGPAPAGTPSGAEAFESFALVDAANLGALSAWWGDGW